MQGPVFGNMSTFYALSNRSSGQAIEYANSPPDATSLVRGILGAEYLSDRDALALDLYLAGAMTFFSNGKLRVGSFDSMTYSTYPWGLTKMPDGKMMGLNKQTLLEFGAAGHEKCGYPRIGQPQEKLLASVCNQDPMVKAVRATRYGPLGLPPTLVMLPYAGEYPAYSRRIRAWDVNGPLGLNHEPDYSEYDPIGGGVCGMGGLSRTDFRGTHFNFYRRTRLRYGSRGKNINLAGTGPLQGLSMKYRGDFHQMRPTPNAMGLLQVVFAIAPHEQRNESKHCLWVWWEYHRYTGSEYICPNLPDQTALASDVLQLALQGESYHPWTRSIAWRQMSLEERKDCSPSYSAAAFTIEEAHLHQWLTSNLWEVNLPDNLGDCEHRRNEHGNMLQGFMASHNFVNGVGKHGAGVDPTPARGIWSTILLDPVPQRDPAEAMAYAELAFRKW